MLVLLLAVAVIPMPTQAMSGACENFANSVTHSYSQAFWYVACGLEMGFWEMYYTFY